MQAAELLRYRLRAARRRALGAGGLLATTGVAAAVGATAAVGLALARVGGADAAAAAGDAARAAARVADRMFWLDALAALVFAYTTFEVVFRAGDTRFLSRLPLRGRSRWLDLTALSLALHLPLLVVPLAYAAGLAGAGAPRLAAYAAALGAATWLAGLPLCAWLHLQAGRSMLGGPSPLKRMLAGQVVVDDAALLLYAPAAGLAGTLVGSLVADGLLRRALGVAGGPASPALLAGTLAAVAAAAAWLVLRGARDADASLAQVVARFAEIDVPAPYRDDGLPERTPGERLAAALPAAARPYFLRDLRQLRRRHRLDRVVLWLFAAWLLRLGLVSDPGDGAARSALVALTLVVALALVGAFRLRGPELASPWLEAALPHPPRARLAGELAADLVHPAWAVAWAAAAAALAEGVAAGLAVGALGAALAVALAASARALARRVPPARVGVASLAWRAAVVLAAVTLAGSPT